MNRLFLLFALLAAWAGSARAADVPARPVPFTFVTDQASLLAPADAKKLEGGLRKYAENTGTQVVVVTVPSLGGTSASAYARELGTSWGVGQRGKNNGIVVLLSGKEHQMSIEAGSGLRSAITPELTQRVMNEMTPAFKQNNYFAGLRTGLNTLMAAANPGSAPKKAAGMANSASSAAAPAPTSPAGLDNAATTSDTTPYSPTTAAEPESRGLLGGLGFGSLLIGALVIGGGIWLLKRLFSRGSNSAAQSQAPDFRGNGGSQTPNFMGNRPNNQGGYQQGGNYGGGYANGPAPSSGGGMGSMGGILATGAAAAAGAYIGNRMSEGHDSGNDASQKFNTAGLGGAAGAVPPANAASDYFGTSGGATNDTAGPDYFSDTDNADNSGDYFSGDNSSYDDTSSDDTGGGGFDSDDNNQGSW